jgi:hypothetical protein
VLSCLLPLEFSGCVQVAAFCRKAICAKVLSCLLPLEFCWKH